MTRQDAIIELKWRKTKLKPHIDKEEWQAINMAIDALKKSGATWDGTEWNILGEKVMSCSSCGASMIETERGMVIPMVTAFDFCPMCGADMRQREETS